MYKIGSYIPTSEKGANNGVAQLDASGKLESSQVSLASTTISTDVIFTDSRATKKGLEYAADYSASFTARSLVDKAYVDANSGGSSMYTADGTLSGNRTVNLNSNTLKFESGQTYIDSGSFNPLVINRQASGTQGNGIDFNAYNSSNTETNFARIIQVATDATAGSEDGGLWLRTKIAGVLRTPVILDNREFLIDAVNFTDNFFRVKDGAIDCLKVNTNNQTYVESGSHNPLVINRKGAGTIGNGIDFNAYNSSNSEHNFARIIQIATSTTAGSENGGLQLRVSDSGTITTKVKIETATTEFSNEGVFTNKAKVYGLDTLSTSTAFQVYDGDGTPSSLWDFRNNGDIIQGKDAKIDLNDNKLTFDFDQSTSTETAPINFEFGGGFGGYYSRWDDNGGLIIKSAAGAALKVVSKVDSTAAMFYVGKEGGGFMSTNGNRLWTIADETTSTTKNEFNDNKISQYFAGTEYHRIQTGGGADSGVFFFRTGFGSLGDFIVGGTAVIGSEDISLQGNSLINGTLDMNNNRITNSVVNPSVQEAANSATFTINSDEQTDGVLTAMSANTTIAAPTGTPVQSQSLVFRFKDDGSARTLTWNAIFRAIGVTLPTTTTASKLLYVGCKYNSTDTKWDVVSVQEEA